MSSLRRLFEIMFEELFLLFQWLNNAEMLIVNGTSNDSEKPDKPSNDPMTKYDVHNTVRDGARFD
jgi:hypothetical protein